MARFHQTFNWLYSRLPFADALRTKLRVWAGAVREQLMLDAPGWAVTFDGVDDALEVAHNAGWGANQGLNITGAISIAFWAFWRNGGLDVDVISSKGAGCYEVETAPGGLVANALRFIPATDVWLDTAAGKFPAGGWNHVVVTWTDAGRVGKIYINGADTEAVKTHDDGAPLAGSENPWSWGRRGDGTNPFKGTLDEVAVWARALTADEVTELYAGGAGLYVEAPSRGGFGYKLRALYHLDEGTGEGVADASLSRADGVLKNYAPESVRWVPGKVPGLQSFQTAANAVYDACFLPTATGADLEKWGEVLRVHRDEGQTDPAFRARLLELWQKAGGALTVEGITEAATKAAEDFEPPLGVTRVDEYYRARVEDGRALADAWSIGERWGLEYADLLTFALVVDRIPTAAEARDLAVAVAAVKPAQTRGYVITARAPDPAVAGPTIYRVRGGGYQAGVAPWLWADEFYRLFLDTGTPASYDAFGGQYSWQIVNPDEYALYGDASEGEENVPHVILPKREKPERVLFLERDVYMDAKLKIYISDAGAGWAGLALRVTTTEGGSPELDEMYALAFWRDHGVSTYALKYWDGDDWTDVVGPAAVGFETTDYRRVEVTLEGQAFTLIVWDDEVPAAPVVLQSQAAVGSALTAPGRWGFITVGTNVDLYVDDFRYW
jgi:hypothetical protein